MISNNALDFYKGLGLILTESLENNPSEKALFYTMNSIYHRFFEIPHFKIDSELTESLFNTKNKIGYRELPYTLIYLDFEKKFNGFGDLENIKKKQRGSAYELLKGMKEDPKITRKFLGIILWRFDTKDNFFITSVIKTGEVYCFWDTNLLQAGGIKNEITRKEDIHIFNKKEKKNIVEFICNFLDFLNHPDVETRIIKHPTNEARIKRGKKPIPDRVKINITGKLYRYIYEELPKMQKESPQFSFWVRGHYIHFWNKEVYRRLYSSDSKKLEEEGYYLDNRGVVCKWVLPYIKNKEKLLQNKNYEVKE